MPYCCHQIEIVGAPYSDEALEMAGKHHVDVILMDLAMPVMGGLEATRSICKEYPAVKVLILTQYSSKEHVLSILEAGAHGFLNKSAASSELINAIRSVYHGDSYLSPSATRYLVQNYKREVNTRKSQDPYEQLTEREKEILRLLAEGHTSKEIAEMLVISPKTVDSHKSRLMAKLDITIVRS